MASGPFPGTVAYPPARKNKALHNTHTCICNIYIRSLIGGDSQNKVQGVFSRGHIMNVKAVLTVTHGIKSEILVPEVHRLESEVGRDAECAF